MPASPPRIKPGHWRIPEPSMSTIPTLINVQRARRFCTIIYRLHPSRTEIGDILCYRIETCAGLCVLDYVHTYDREYTTANHVSCPQLCAQVAGIQLLFDGTSRMGRVCNCATRGTLATTYRGGVDVPPMIGHEGEEVRDRRRQELRSHIS